MKPATVRTGAESEEGAIGRLVYYASDKIRPHEDESNRGLSDVQTLLKRVRALGLPVEVVDTTTWGSEDQWAAYARALEPAVVRHSKEYSVRRAFGTRRRGGCFFGREVPALVVYRGWEETAADVYPHYGGESPVTIRDFLVRLLEDPSRIRPPRGPGLTPAVVTSLMKVRRRVFGDRRLPDDSAALIREAREGR